MAGMYFRLKYSTRKFFLRLNAPLKVSLRQGDEKIAIEIRHPNRKERKHFKEEETLFWIAAVTRAIPDEHLKVFQEWTANRIDLTHLSKPLKGGGQLPRYVSRDGRIEENWAVESWLFPKAFQELCSGIWTDLADANRTVARLIRWRHDVVSQHNISFASVACEWSNDRKTWRPMPHRMGGTILMGTNEKEDYRIKPAEISMLARKGNKEPLGHELYREASLQRGSNSRSALVMLVAAIETAFKQFLVSVCPDTEWLITNLQSPPLKRMLRDYFPTLPRGRKSREKVPPLPKGLLKTIEVAVAMRNDLVHGKPVTLSREFMNEVDHTARDFLWLLDLYSGHDWALQHITPKTRRLLGLPEEPVSVSLKRDARVVEF